MNSPWLVVLNPISGQGRAMQHRHEIEAVLRRHGIDFTLEISDRPEHAIEIVSRAIAGGCRHVLAVGGDGTVNECVNGIFRQDAVATTAVTLGVMPIGTGNDWARGLRMPKDYAEVAALMAAGTSRLHDVGLAEFDDGGKSHLRYFINVAGIGFDAHVVESLPDRTLGPMAYLVGLVKGLLSYTAVSLRLTFTERKLETRAFVLFFAIGRYCGSGMNVAPQAEADDGLFDVTLVQELSRWEVLKSLRRLFDGTLLTHPKVLAMREAWGAVETTSAQPVEADGELIGHAPVRFSILPRALNVVAPPPQSKTSLPPPPA
jgi:YegS/Rv2252/BmrU family lipid kinase